MPSANVGLAYRLQLVPCTDMESETKYANGNQKHVQSSGSMCSHTQPVVYAIKIPALTVSVRICSVLVPHDCVGCSERMCSRFWPEAYILALCVHCNVHPLHETTGRGLVPLRKMFLHKGKTNAYS